MCFEIRFWYFLKFLFDLSQFLRKRFIHLPPLIESLCVYLYMPTHISHRKTPRDQFQSILFFPLSYSNRILLTIINCSSFLLIPIHYFFIAFHIDCSLFVLENKSKTPTWRRAIIKVIENATSHKKYCKAFPL